MTNSNPLNELEIAEIVALRKRAYEGVFTAGDNPNGVRWSFTDAHSIHITANEGERLVGALRLSLVSKPEAFKRITTFDWPEGGRGRAGIMARAAIEGEWRSKGLHSLLREKGLEFFMSQDVASVWGTLPAEAQRLEQLLELGYRVIETKEQWDSGCVSAQGPVHLIALDGPAQIEKALTDLRERNFSRDHSFKNLDIVVKSQSIDWL